MKKNIILLCFLFSTLKAYSETNSSLAGKFVSQIRQDKLEDTQSFVLEKIDKDLQKQKKFSSKKPSF